MNPESLPPAEMARRSNFVRAALDAQRGGLVAQQAMHMALNQPELLAGIDRLQARDAGNGLYAYLGLLQHLRQPSAALTRPATLAALSGELRRLASAPTVRLHHRAMQEQIERSLRERAGLDERDAAVEALRVISYSLRSPHRPVLRELVDRLLALSASLAAAGQVQDALLADRLAVRLLTEIVADSPTYDVGLLSAELLPSALQRLGEDARRLGSASADDAATAADAAGQLALAWHAAYTGEVNALPFSGQLPPDIAAAAERRVLRGFVWAAAATAAHVWVWVLLTATGVLVLAARSARSTVLAPRRRGSDWLGAGILLTPLFLVLLAAGGLVSFTWLFTLNSGYALILFTPAWFLSLAVAGRVGFQSADNSERHQMLVWPAAVLAGAVLLMVVAGLIALPVRQDGSRPPGDVQLLRKLLALTGIASGLAVCAWFVIGQLRRIRRGAAAGLRAKAQLGVLTRALPISAALMLAALWGNAWQDRSHQRAYAHAARDPVADKLGSDWQAHYMGPAAQVAEQLGASGSSQPHLAPAGPTSEPRR
jgi:hypothetical protein